jgi:hypothetical protein
VSDRIYCVNHPDVETYLRCNRCGQPICTNCAVRTPVGYRCRDCVNRQQQVFYSGFKRTHYLVAAAVALPLSAVAGWLVPSLGWYSVVLGPLAGGGIANVALWAIRRRRGRYTWLVVGACVVLGALPYLTVSLIRVLGLLAIPGRSGLPPVSDLVWHLVYSVSSVGAALAWLRPGRRA